MTHDDDFDPFIAGIAQELRRPVTLDARFDERVMAALAPRVMSLTPARVVRPWYRKTFAFSVSQVAGLAAAAGFVGVVSMKLLAPSPSAPVAAVSAPTGELVMEPVARVTRDPNAPQMQQFLLIAPSATSVSLVGDFSDWDDSRFKMERVSDDGAWSITIPLVPGRYEYQFEIDGAQRVNDPTRPQTSSEFGSANSVVTVERRD